MDGKKTIRIISILEFLPFLPSIQKKKFKKNKISFIYKEYYLINGFIDLPGRTTLIPAKQVTDSTNE